ncbi:hypothetical protein BGZ74_009147 [Mortierella antarctica]|nr:hypothetical protein BGZ74_009147 [Mortierella antarctica]
MSTVDEKHQVDAVHSEKVSISEDKSFKGNDDEEFPFEEHQFTWRAAIVGSLLGCVVAASNLYVGLKIGWTFGASLWGAIFGFIILKPIARAMGNTFGPRENATCQAAATTAGGLSTGFVTAIPALYRMGLMGEGATPKGDIMQHADQVWGWAWSWDFSFFGAGLMTPASTVWSFLLGEFIAYGLAGPLMVDSGYLLGPRKFTLAGNGSAQSWFLWPGIALMVFTAFGELAVNGKSLWHGVKSGILGLRNIVRRLTKRGQLKNESNYVSKDTVPEHLQVPTLWWTSGLLVSGVFTVVIMAVDFKVPVYSTLLAIVLSFILAFVGLQASGETDINPTGSIGKVTQLVFSRFPGDLAVVQKTNLMCANISASVCAQAVDMVGDLKTGHLLGASPRSQFLAQCVGSVFAIVAAVPLFILYTEAYKCIIDESVTTCEFGLVAVVTWQAVCKLLTTGGTVPKASVITAGVCCVLAIANILFRIKCVPEKIRPYWINLNAVGLGLINPSPALAMAMLTGWAAGRIWVKISQQSHEKHMYSVAGGFISGVGVAGIIKALLVLGSVKGGSVTWGCIDGEC